MSRRGSKESKSSARQAGERGKGAGNEEASDALKIRGGISVSSDPPPWERAILLPHIGRLLGAVLEAHLADDDEKG